MFGINTDVEVCVVEILEFKRNVKLFFILILTDLIYNKHNRLKMKLYKVKKNKRNLNLRMKFI